MKDLAVSDKLKANYENYYEGKSEWRWLGAIDKVNNIVSLCKNLPNSKILEIGSGEGSILKRLSDLQFGESLYSLEISKSAVETIHKRNIPSLVECKLFDGYTIPYEDNIFDITILSHVVEHLEYPRKMLYEASRVSKYVFIEVPLNLNILLKKNFVFDSVGHINFYSPKTIRILVQTCDLEILSQLITNPSKDVYTYAHGKKGLLLYVLKGLTLRIVPWLITGILGYHCSIVCRKKPS